MPTLGWDYGDEHYRRLCAKRKAREAKLLAKGIKPGSSKFYTLMSRRK